MTRERWQRIEQIFHSVLAGAPQDRALLLDTFCKDDAELRREVELLLAAQTDSGSFLETRNLPRAAPEHRPKTETAAVGRKIGHYEVLGTIGAGAMGEVYLARDTRLDRNVALKVLPPRFAADRERVSRFMREAKASSALNHPNIVTLHDIGEDQGLWYITTEFIEGLTLRQRLAGGRLETSEALDIAIQCAAALTAAHAAGVSHRDIKPENIMIRPDGLVKIVDFGLARVANTLLNPGVTETEAGALMGTPRYMSPEQARGERSDAASDIFSLGAVLYEMLAGAPAVPGATTAETLAALLASNPEPLSLRRPGLPSAIDAILTRALAKNRAARYQSMQEFAAALRDLKQTLELTRTHAASGRWKYGATAAILATAALGGWWMLRDSARAGHPDAPRQAVPLTSFEGFKDYSAIAPDGKRVAFSWNGGLGGFGGKQEREIYVKPVGSGDPLQLTHSDQDNLWPSWSRDGRNIVFGRRHGDSETTFYTVPSNGGLEREVAKGGAGVSWSPDGETIAMPRSANASGGIFLMSLKTGAQRDLTTPKPNYDALPSFSPDGRWIAFTRGSTDLNRAVWIVPAAGGEGRMLVQDIQQILGVTWTPDSREVVYGAIGEGSGHSLWRVPVAGGGARLVEGVPDGASNPSISGSRLSYTLSFLDTNIYRSEGAALGGSSAKFGAPAQFVVSSREDDSARFSPDGMVVAFVSTRSGVPEIWTAQRDGRHVSQLTFFKGSTLGSPHWSPDGRQIAFDCRNAHNTDLFVIGADGRGLRRVTTDPAGDYMPAWSADSQWIYFTSDRSGRPELWKMPAAGGDAIRITQGGARESWPAPDGKRIYYTHTRPEGQIWTVPPEGGDEQPVPELKSYDRIARTWGVVPSGIYFISRRDGPRQEVRFFNFATRQVTLLTTLDKEPIWYLPAIALSPDARSLLTVHVDQQVNDLMMIEDFR
jgi:Tol biopolymer transport system component